MRIRMFKFVIIIAGLLLPTLWCGANSTRVLDGYSNITIKVGNTHGAPKTSSIQASIDGHCLSIVFLENLGQVSIVITMVSGGEIQSRATPTPNGVDFFISNTGSYIVTITLTNGDEYYGEFEVTD